ncbi:YhjD/YihY/BrkB family envelope integrity protein [Cryobacterium sp. PH31-AA6]|uniref:YhjD/YihY/BrkB family envelope integrity protein n=1 Tax=Cryobacterium sp. PH31-AA6 TaxID=3046205 RepID=UPI0024B8BEE1|nr:YhjD/YihY/BrkB family envelope integrity protein [Cryobacterium sp. PH31-AA6]MDJ0324674.1 YhjD/YihY/BrkB family envelope integrity protein [Cryobacterium sp. PH31-AA6]
MTPAASTPVKPLARLVKRVKAWRPVRAVTHFSDARGALLAGGMTYQAVFAIFAAIWVGFSIAGLVLGSNDQLMSALIGIINQSIPGLIATGGVIDPEKLTNTGELTWIGAVALVGLLWTTLGWLSTTTQAVRTIFGMPRDSTFFVLAKLRELGLGILFGLALIVSAVISLASTELLGFILGLLGVSRESFWFNAGARTIGLLVVLAIDTATLAALFRVLSRVHIPLPQLVRGSLVGGVALGALKVLGGNLLGRTGANPLLAAFAVIIGLLIWFNLMNTVILITASWVAVGMEAAGIPATPIDKEQAARDQAEREADARRIAALAELRDATEARERADWRHRWAATRRLHRAQERAEEYADPAPAGETVHPT